MNWQDRVAFISAGVSGIGFGIARAFAGRGLRLALSYRNEAHRADAARWFAGPASACSARPTSPATTTTTGSWRSTSVAWSTELSAFCRRSKPMATAGTSSTSPAWQPSSPVPRAGIYTASKFAVRGLTECLRYNLAPHGIGVSLVCPGLTRSNAWDSALRRPARYASSDRWPNRTVRCSLAARGPERG